MYLKVMLNNTYASNCKCCFCAYDRRYMNIDRQALCNQRSIFYDYLYHNHDYIKCGAEVEENFTSNQ